LFVNLESNSAVTRVQSLSLFVHSQVIEILTGGAAVDALTGGGAGECHSARAGSEPCRANVVRPIAGDVYVRRGAGRERAGAESQVSIKCQCRGVAAHTEGLTGLVHDHVIESLSDRVAVDALPGAGAAEGNCGGARIEVCRR